MGVSEILSTIRRLPEILDLRGRDTADAGALPLRRRLARGAFWAVTGTGVSRVLALLASIAVARVLGKTGFGEFGMVQSTMGIFTSVAGFGTAATAAKHVAEYRGWDGEKAGRILALAGVAALVFGLAASGLLFAFAPLLSERVLAEPGLAPLLQAGSPYLLLSALNGAQMGALGGFEAFRTIAKLNVAVGLAHFPLVVGGVYLGGIEGAVWGLVAAMGFAWILTHFALRREAARAGVPFHLRGCLRERGILWSFSLPALLRNVTSGSAMWACNVVVVNQPGGYAEMGLLSAVLRWYAIVLFLPAQFSKSLFPVLSWHKGHRGREENESLLGKSAWAVFLLATAAAVPVMVLAPLIMSAYGGEFEAGTCLLRYAGAVAMLMALSELFVLDLGARGRMWTAFGINAVWLASLVGVTYFLRAQGAAAVVVGMFAAAVVKAGLSFLVLGRPGSYRERER